MKKLLFNNGESTLQLSWKDYATLLPAEVSKKVAEYAGENITPNIMIKASTGEVTVCTPLFANLKQDPNAVSPTAQAVSDEAKAALKSKGLVTWGDALKMVNDRTAFFNLVKLGILKYEEVDGVLLTIPEADITALNSFMARICDNHAE